MPQYLLSHDLGTSGNKAALFTQDGCMAASVTVPYRTISEKPGWAEQESGDWWHAVVSGTKMLLEKLPKADVAAIACTGQMMGCLCLGNDGCPVMRSITVADSRSTAQCDDLTARFGAKTAYNIIGQPISPNFTLAKLMWLKENRRDIYERAAVCLQSKDYITYKMTGRIVTDRTDAAFFQCFDIRKNDWSDELLSAAGIDSALLPEVVDSAQMVGRLTAEAASQLGIQQGIPVMAGAGDGPASCLGSGAVAKGIAVLTLGTTAGFSAMADTPYYDPLCRTPSGPCVIPGLFGIGGGLQSGGGTLAWAKSRLLGDGVSFASCDELVAKSPPGANGIIFLPYLLGERSPIWNPRARASFVNLGEASTTNDMLRAVFEGVALHLGLIKQTVSQCVTIDKIVINGGGASSGLWCSILSDVLGAPVYIMSVSAETTSFGAAVIAGVGVGMYPDYSIIPALMAKRLTMIEPDMKTHAIYHERLKLFTEIYKALEPFYNSINR